MARNLSLAIVVVCVSLLHAEEHHVVQFSDTHLPVAGSDATVAKAAADLDGADAVIVTGDLTEFGGLDSLEKFDKVFARVRAPLVPTLGNHDATWRSLHDVFWKRYGRNYYAKDAGPFRVLALDSSTCQDPRPHWDPAQLAWISSEARAAKGWLLPSFHHPPWGSEFASPWARARLAVALGAPVACVLTGHNHSSSTREWGGLRVVVGGAAQGKDAGYTVIATKGEKLVGTYHPNEGDVRPVFTDPLPRALVPLPEAEVRIEKDVLLVRLAGGAPLASGSFVEVTGGAKARVGPDGVARVPFAELDKPVPSSVEGERARSGPRGVVVSEGEHGRLSVGVAEIPGSRRRFRVNVGSSVRSQPVVLRDLLLVGTERGELVALDPRTGAEQWRIATEGMVLAAPIEPFDLHFVSGDGNIWAFNEDGSGSPRFKLGAPVYSRPQVHGDDVVATDLDGTLHRIDTWPHMPHPPNVYKPLRFAAGPVEAPGLIVSGTTMLLQGAWDQRVHAIDIKGPTTGPMRERWSVETDGPRAQKAKRYYSPADAPLALTGDVLAACDRDSKLTLIDVKSGERLGGVEDAWAVVSCDGGFVVKGAKTLRRIDTKGTVLWTTPVKLGRTPAAPLLHRGVVWTCSDDGEATAVDASTGAVLHRERVNPGELVLASPGAEGDLVYFGSLDGSVTALDAGR